MKKVGIALSSALTLAGAVVAPTALGSDAHATAVGPAVKVEIRSLTKDLLPPTTEHGENGWITKGGMPRGVCSGNSAAGALDAATHGKWAGQYYAKYRNIFVTKIDGVTPKSPDYWEFLVNGKISNVGVCQVKLHAGERLLFKIVK